VAVRLGHAAGSRHCHNIRTRTRQPSRDRTTDTGGPAGDERPLPCEVKPWISHDTASFPSSDGLPLGPFGLKLVASVTLVICESKSVPPLLRQIRK